MQFIIYLLYGTDCNCDKWHFTFPFLSRYNQALVQQHRTTIKNNMELKINTKSVLVNWKRENKYFISTKRCNRKGIRCTRDGTVTMKQNSILLETWHKINQLADSSQNLREKGIGKVPAWTVHLPLPPCLSLQNQIEYWSRIKVS